VYYPFADAKALSLHNKVIMNRAFKIFASGEFINFLSTDGELSYFCNPEEISFTPYSTELLIKAEKHEWLLTVDRILKQDGSPYGATIKLATDALVLVCSTLLGGAGTATQVVTGTVGVNNFPATQPVSGTVNVGNLPATQPVSGTVAVSNLPATQPVSGTVNVQGGNSTAVKTDGSAVTQPVSGTVAVSNLPATQPVSGTVNVQGGNSTAVKTDGSAVTQPVSGTIAVSNLPATQPVSGTVAISNLPATQPVSGNVNTGITTPAFVKITDGVGTAVVLSGTPNNSSPGLVVKNAPDAIGNTQTIGSSLATAVNIKNTDGINTAAVKAANTPAVATDPAMVVAISPNNPITTSAAPDITIGSVVGNALNIDLITGDFSQFKSLKVNLAGTFVASWTVQVANEPTFASPQVAQIFQQNVLSLINGQGTTGTQFTVSTIQGRYIRIRVTAYTSGSIVATISGSFADVSTSLTEATFSNRIPTNGQKIASASLPVVLPSNSTIDIEKEWFCRVATGTPLAAVGDRLVQVVKNNGGTLVTTWFNMTQSALFTVAPVVANLSLSPIKTPWSWSATVNGMNGSASYSICGGSGQTNVGGVVTTGISPATGYTVPVGKKLIITSISFAGWCNNWHTPGATADVAGIIDIRATNAAGALYCSLPYATIGQNGFTAEPTSTHTPSFQSSVSYPDGAIEIPAGTVIVFASGNSSPGGGYATGINIQGGVTGYLINA
jgi:hypothetical protein